MYERMTNNKAHDRHLKAASMKMWCTVTVQVGDFTRVTKGIESQVTMVCCNNIYILA